MEKPFDNTWLIPGIVVIGLGIVAAWAIEQTWTLRCLQDSARLTRGQITEAYTRSGKGGRSYHLTYRFAPDGGPFFVGGERVLVAVYNAAKTGDGIDILHCAADPARNTLDVGRLLRSRDSFVLVFGIMAAFALAFGVLHRVLRRWNSKAREEGPDLPDPLRFAGGRGSLAARGGYIAKGGAGRG